LGYNNGNILKKVYYLSIILSDVMYWGVCGVCGVCVVCVWCACGVCVRCVCGVC